MRTICVIALIVAASSPAVAQSRLHVTSGTAADGSATEQWLAILQKRLTESEFNKAGRVIRPLTADELAWERLIRARRAEWERMTDRIERLYEGARPPQHVLIVTGNRGASDAFVHDQATIGFDLSALQAQYGAATEPVNVDRMDRLFRHEYAHLMQKAWLLIDPYEPGTPLEHALLDIWLEGLGTYHSLSERWRTTAGRHSQAARDALDIMEPRLLVRLSALTCSSPDDASLLTADLSQGAFDRKWGALTAGLWLENEAGRGQSPDDALRSFIRAGPAGVWDLAARQLSPRLRSLLVDIRDVEQLCNG